MSTLLEEYLVKCKLWEKLPDGNKMLHELIRGNASTFIRLNHGTALNENYTLNSLLEKAKRVTFGRSSKADLPIPNALHTVSRLHGEFLFDDSGSITYKDTSRFGSVVEDYKGKRIETPGRDTRVEKNIVVLFPNNFYARNGSALISFGREEEKPLRYTLELVLERK